MWVVRQHGRLHFRFERNGVFDFQILPDDWGFSPSREQADLLCEALNVQEQTGLTPKQMLEKLKMLQDDGK